MATGGALPNYDFQVWLKIPGASNSQLQEMQVVRFTGTEEISKPFLFHIEAMTRDPTTADATAPGALLQSAATLACLLNGEVVGSFSGIIIGVTHLGSDIHESQLYRIELAPPLWLMSLNRRSRIFKACTGSDVISSLISEYALTSSTQGSGSFEPETILQHQESDLEFFERLLANYGLFYTFTDVSSGCNLKILKTNSDCGSSGNALAVEIGDVRSEKSAKFQCREEIVVKQVVVTDYNPQDPTKPVQDVGDLKTLLKPRGVAAQTSVISAKGDSTIAYQDDAPLFPSGSTAQLTPGKSLAAGIAARQQTFSGTGTAPEMRAGGCIQVSGHDLAEYNDEYVLTTVKHTYDFFGDAGYANEYTAILVSGPPYLMRARTAPSNTGLRLGLVVSNSATSTLFGPTDTAATYLIQFPQEIDQTGVVLEQVARLATPSAGPDRGFHFPLEVGDEVVVINHLGDPARPIIVGALFHQTSAVSPLVSTQDGKVLSRVLRSGKGAELRFDDDDNKSMVTLSSGTLDHTLVFDDTNKATNLVTKQDLLISASGKADVTITKNLSVSTQADYSLTTSGKSSHSAGDDYSFTGSAKVTAQATGDVSVSGNGKTSLSSVGAITVSSDDSTKMNSVGAMSLTSDDSITLTSGSASIVIKASGEITINGVKVTLSASDTLAQTGTSQVTIGGANISVSADAQLKLAGSAMTQVTGGIIKLN